MLPRDKDTSVISAVIRVHFHYNQGTSRPEDPQAFLQAPGRVRPVFYRADAYQPVKGVIFKRQGERRARQEMQPGACFRGALLRARDLVTGLINAGYPPCRVIPGEANGKVAAAAAHVKETAIRRHRLQEWPQEVGSLFDHFIYCWRHGPVIEP